MTGATGATGATEPTGAIGHGCLDPSPDRATPWGAADQVEIAPGILFGETAAYCFYRLDAARNAMVHAVFRAADGFYEEAADGAKVIFSFPEAFRPDELAVAVRILQCRYPDAYEAVTGETPGRVETPVVDFRHLGDFVRLPVRRPDAPAVIAVCPAVRPSPSVSGRSVGCHESERSSGPVVTGLDRKRGSSGSGDC